MGVQVEKFEVIKHTQPMAPSKKDIKWFNDDASSWQRMTINPDTLNLRVITTFKQAKGKLNSWHKEQIKSH